MLTDETKQELAERFGLTLPEIRCVESECVRPVSVRVLQARARACVSLAEGKTLLQRFAYKLAEVEIPEGATEKLQCGVLEDDSRRRHWWWPLEQDIAPGEAKRKPPDHDRFGKFRVVVGGAKT